MTRYIIRGNGLKAIAVHSDMNWLEMTDYIRNNSPFVHEDSSERVFRLGGIEILSPEVMSPNDFANFCPYLIGIK